LRDDWFFLFSDSQGAKGTKKGTKKMNAPTHICGRAAPSRAIDLNQEVLHSNGNVGNRPLASSSYFLSPDGACDRIARNSRRVFGLPSILQ
jgi:hypothetical protein